MTRCYIIYVPTLRCILLYSDSKNYYYFYLVCQFCGCHFAGLSTTWKAGPAGLSWLIAGAEIQQHAFLAEEFRRHKMLRKLFIGKIQCF